MRGRRPRITIAAWLAVVATASCGSYVPRASPHIVRDAGDVFHRDGHEYSVGLLGGGADALVAGDGRALEHARRHQRLVREGTLFYALGLAGVLVGAAASSSVDSPARRNAVLWGSFGGGLAVTGVGIALMLDGKAALVDAINVYNDDVDASSGGAP